MLIVGGFGKINLGKKSDATSIRLYSYTCMKEKRKSSKNVKFIGVKTVSIHS